MLRILEFFFGKPKKKKRKVLQNTNANAIELIQIEVEKLELGMYVAELDIPWLESPFLFQGFEIETEKQLKQFKEVCQFVYIDASKQKINTVKKRIDTKKESKSALIISEPPELLGSFETEIDRAELSYKETGILVADFMEKVASGGGIDSKSAKEAVSACVNSVLHSPDAFLWLSQLKDKDKYTAQHSVNVCVLSIVLARQLGLSEENLNNVGMCGMMHDMGKMLVPLDVLNKPGKLDPDERQKIQQHTTLGHELLKSSDHMFYGAIETALTHHEHMNGKGYPSQLTSRNLTYYSNIVAVADTYDAITSDRVYQKGRTHYEAVRIMLDVSDSHLDSKLVVKFIESLGAYPPGCFVELSHGAIALVVEKNYQNNLWPKVLLILDSNKQVVKEQILDLSKLMTDKAGLVISIKGIIKPSDYNIDSKKYYQKGVIQKGFKK